MAITSISPRKATRGATGTQITIAGSGFGASQGAGTLTIGNVAVIVDTWSATSIACRADDSPATPLGSQDVVLTPDGGTAETEYDAVYVYDATDESDSTELDVGTLDDLGIFIDGLHVGKLPEDAVSWAPADAVLDFVPNDGDGNPFHTIVTGRSGVLSFVLSQINGANLAHAFGGTYTDATKTLEILGTRTITGKSIMIVDAAGRGLFFPKCQLIAPGGLSLAPRQWMSVPVAWRCLPARVGGVLARVVLP